VRGGGEGTDRDKQQTVTSILKSQFKDHGERQKYLARQRITTPLRQQVKHRGFKKKILLGKEATQVGVLWGRKRRIGEDSGGSSPNE